VPVVDTGERLSTEGTNDLLGQWRLEATLVHLRVMIEFLTFKRGSVPKGVVADDHFDHAVHFPSDPGLARNPA
jgi:hypothetical protein